MKTNKINEGKETDEFAATQNPIEGKNTKKNDKIEMATETKQQTKSEINHEIKPEINLDDPKSSKLSQKVLGCDLRKEEFQFFQPFMYVLSVILVLLGLWFLYAEIGKNLGKLGEYMLSFGLGISLFLSGSLCMKFFRHIGWTLQAIATFLIPIGIFILVRDIPINSSSSSNLVLGLGFSSIAILYFFADKQYKNSLYTVGTILFASISYFSFVAILFQGNNSLDESWLFQLFIILYTVPLIILGRNSKNVVDSTNNTDNHSKNVENKEKNENKNKNWRHKTFRFFEGFGYFIVFLIMPFFLKNLFVQNERVDFWMLFLLCSSFVFASKFHSKTLMTHTILGTVMYIFYTNFNNYRGDNFRIGFSIFLLFSGLILMVATYYLFKKMEKTLSKIDNKEKF